MIELKETDTPQRFDVLLDGEKICTALGVPDESITLLALDGWPIADIYARESGVLFDAILDPIQENISKAAPELSERYQRQHFTVESAVEYVAGHIQEGREQRAQARETGEEPAAAEA